MSCQITLNGKSVQVPAAASLLEVCRDQGIFVPSLCYHPRLPIEGSCRLCLVETGEHGSLVPSCATKISEGMVVNTNTEKIRKHVAQNLELLASRHCFSCASCEVNGSCELQDLMQIYNVPQPTAPSHPVELPPLPDNAAIKRDPSKCILCGRCVRACEEVQGMGALALTGRSTHAVASTPFGQPFEESSCVLCGQCTSVCPTGALTEVSVVPEVLAEIRGPRTVIVNVAPAVRVGISETFDLEPGTISTGQLTTALRRAGFDHVFDTNFTADLTIMEEGTELLHRLSGDAPMPMFTSCCPGWVNGVEKLWPELIPHLSSCRSPQGMMGALVKGYWAQVAGCKPEDIVHVSIMPCTAKKDEAGRDQLTTDAGLPEVDYVLTVREAGRLLEGMDVPAMEESEFDSPLGESTGGAVIFGASGGVMEAALRTVHSLVVGEPLPDLHFEPVRGTDVDDGLKVAEVQLGDRTVKVAVAHGGEMCREVAEGIIAGEEEYADLDFVEFMMCPGGCLGGGGMPKDDEDTIADRATGLYQLDDDRLNRSSHENIAIQKLYADYYGEPGSELAHHQLHTSYEARK
eukprot:gnl/Dysnectes_brevis/758_a833_2236.p1 GENE.gnl/Dysnectes_brevis/758_a833_2236~~gnl/Dysnectes_brevis/758_a833_2236.p1  ORF type:complete len:575 (-),score=180.27 gnl/Dysnectes_brevis/758_a833_2236:64-1788(-)